MTFSKWLDRCEHYVPTDWVEYLPPILAFIVFLPMFLASIVIYWLYHLALLIYVLFMPPKFRKDSP